MNLSNDKWNSMFRLVNKYLGKITLVSTILAVAVAIFTNVFLSDTYTNSLLLQANYEKQNEETEVEAISASKSLAKLYTEFLDSGETYASIKKNLNLNITIPELRSKLVIENKKNTSLIEVTSTDKNGKDAIALSNEILNTAKLKEYISDGKLKVESLATENTEKVDSASPVFNGILAFILVSLLSWAYVFIKTIFSKYVKSPRQIKENFNDSFCLLLPSQQDVNYNYDLEKIKNQLIIKNKKELGNIVTMNTFSNSDNSFIKDLTELFNKSDIKAKHIKFGTKTTKHSFKKELNKIESSKYEIIIVENLPFDSAADSLIPLIFSDHNYTIISQNKVTEKDLKKFKEALKFTGFKTNFILNDYKITEDIL